jgi:hypothetical protein
MEKTRALAVKADRHVAIAGVGGKVQCAVQWREKKIILFGSWDLGAKGLALRVPVVS